MDPELIEQLNSQFAQMNELIRQQNSMMATQVTATQEQTGAAKNSSTAFKNNASAAGNAANEVTKLQQTQQAASEKMAVAMNNFSRSFDSGSNAVKSFSKALLSSEEGFKKYGSAVEGAGQAAFDIGKNFGILGTVLGGAIKGLTMFASQALATHDTMIQMNRDVTKFAGVIPGTTRNFADLSAKAGYAGDSMAKMTKFIQGLGTNVAAMGDTAGAGAIRFAKLADVGNTVKESFSKLGVSQESLTEMQGYYIKQQVQSGNSLALRTKSEEKLRKESLAYAENLVKMSSITGETAESMQQEREVVKSEFEERVRVRRDELKAQQLEAAGDKAGAAEIRNQTLARQTILDRITADQGKEVASMFGRVMRQGGFDSFSGGLATLGINAQEVSAIMKGATTETERNAAAVKVSQMYLTKMNEGIQTFGPSMEYAGAELGKATAITSDAMGKNEKSIGRTVEEMEAAAVAGIAEAKELKDKSEEERAKLDTAEREAREKAQKALLTLAETIMPAVRLATEAAAAAMAAIDELITNKLIPTLEKLSAFINNTLLPNIKTFGVALGILAGVAGIGLGIKLFKSLASAGKGLVSIFGWMGNQIKALFTSLNGGAAGTGPARDARGRFTRAPVSGAGAGKLLKFAKGAASGIGGLLGGLALDYGADVATEKGYTKTGAGLSVGSAALTGAGLGATVGSVVPGLGTAVGGAVGGALGGAYGLYQNWNALTGDDETSTAKEEVKNTATKIKTSADKGQSTAELNEKTATLQNKNNTTFNGSIDTFGTYVAKFANTIKDMMDRLSTMAGPFGTAGSGADSPATVEAAMRMQLQSESGGGKQLRVKGLGNASSIGGAYGLSQGARESAYNSMSSGQKQQFAAQTGFTKAPTLDELVNKAGTGFVSEGAEAADKMLSQQFTATTIENLGRKLGRVPTMTDVRGSHWLGEAGYVALLNDAQKNPNMTMADFYAAHPNFGSPDMKQFMEKGKIRTVTEHLAKIREQAGGQSGGAGGGDIASLGAELQKQGLVISGHSQFGGQEQGRHASNSRHYRDMAIDINAPGGIVEANDKVWGSKFDNLSAQLKSAGYNVMWRTGGHNNHIHASTGGPEGVSAARGGVFDGSTGGYPATLHGTEIVAPISLDSILMKLAKTPASDASLDNIVSGKNTSTDTIEKIIMSNSELASIISRKLDNVIDALDNGNDTRTKILRHTM